MAYTQDDLNAIREAKKTLAEGRRVGESMHRNRRIRFSEVSMEDLERMEAAILRELNPKRVRYSLLRTDKGY